MKLTQQDKARLLGVTPMTLRNWKKQKPYLYAIIEKGFAFESLKEQAKSNYDFLEQLDKSLETSIQK